MTWFKVDDALAMHPKAFAAGNAALGLWVRAGSWSAQQLTDGFIPREVIPALGGDWDTAVALIRAKLWHEADGGYQFHDWADYQPTREQVLAERAAAAERKRKSRARSQGESHRDSQRPDGGSHSSPSRPVPTPTTGYVSESSNVPERARNDENDEEAARRDSLCRSTLASGFGIDPDRLIAHIAQRTNRTVDAAGAMRVATMLLDKGKDVKKPQSYVLRSITESWAEVQQFIDATAT